MSDHLPPRVFRFGGFVLDVSAYQLLRQGRTISLERYRFIANLEAAPSTVLAVLPFTNLQGDAQHDDIADGLTEETIVGLGRTDPERLSVIGRTTSMPFRNTTRTLDEVGRQLGADYLVEGTLRAACGRYRITSRLIRARDQVQVWTESYDREASDLLGLQSELGGAIARQIRLRLSPLRPAQPSRQTKSPEAFDLYLRGRDFFNQMTQATAARALECFRGARRPSIPPTRSPGRALPTRTRRCCSTATPNHPTSRPTPARPQRRRFSTATPSRKRTAPSGLFTCYSTGTGVPRRQVWQRAVARDRIPRRVTGCVSMETYTSLLEEQHVPAGSSLDNFHHNR